jgi:hypothetical protein
MKKGLLNSPYLPFVIFGLFVFTAVMTTLLYTNNPLALFGLLLLPQIPFTQQEEDDDDDDSPAMGFVQTGD